MFSDFFFFFFYLCPNPFGKSKHLLTRNNSVNTPGDLQLLIKRMPGYWVRYGIY